jgi:hypothetical protein
VRPRRRSLFQLFVHRALGLDHAALGLVVLVGERRRDDLAEHVAFGQRVLVGLEQLAERQPLGLELVQLE